MPPKHKNKGKGVGKGQSNRHKSSRPQEGDTTSKEKNKTASNLTLCSADVLSIDSSPKSDHSICHNNRNIENASDLGVCKNKMHSRYRSRLVSKEDPLMADLVWRSVSPDDERIPRLSFFLISWQYIAISILLSFEHCSIYIRI